VSVVSLAGVVLFMLASVVVGTRLLLLWRITRQLPELLLAIALWCTGFLGFALETVARSAPGLADQSRFTIILLGLVGEYVGAAALILFAWRVFRPQEGWAASFALLLGVTLAGALAGEILSGQYMRYIDSELIEGPAVPFGIAARGLAPAWMAVEAFRYHAMLRRRVRLGLAEPVVVHRLALWGTATAASALAHAGTAYHRIRYGSALMEHDWALNTVSALAFVAAVGIAFAFFPPAFYRRLLARTPAVRS
jgi:hypothetical protein